MKKTILTILTSFLAVILYSQPANNTCGTAQNLGTLPTPANCPNGVGPNVNITGTTINATYPIPYDYLLGCQTGGDQPAPSPDVWYQFVASGNQVNINITPGTNPFLSNPSITLWSGSCGSLNGFNCDNNGTTNGNNTTTFEPLTAGQTYYIQVSGSTSTSTGNFNMVVNASNDCNNCLQNVGFFATPNPINGTYLPGQTVNFCLSINGYNQVSANWLHGVIPTFSNGWNLASLVNIPANACSTTGNWQWANSNTSSATGNITGPGFYYFSGPGGAGNNYGDAGSNCTRIFCWSIQTNSNCTSGNNLSISVNTTADGETGSWTSPACQGDPDVNFSAQLNCCQSIATGTPPTCFSGNNGSATVTTTGGVGPFTYSWNTTPVQTTQIATGLSAGNYSVTVTDNAGCISTATVIITQPTQLTVITTSTSATCGQINGSSTATPSGGSGPYTYSWNTTPSQTTQTATGLGSGNYTVTVTSIGGCIANGTVNIVSTGSISSTSTSTNVSCNGYNNGIAIANPIGGSIYTYLWNTTPQQTTQTATGLSPGSYTCSIVSFGCQTTTTVNITQPSVLTAAITTSNVSCNGGTNGSATVTPSGGTTGYTYIWTTTPQQTSSVANNLSTGTYSVNITDINSCTVIASANIVEPQPLNLSLVSTQNPNCNGSTNGQILVSSNGGIGPTYFYTLNGGTPQTSGQFTGLSSGNYTISVQDANSCTQQIQVLLTQPTPISSSYTVTNVNCNGGNNGQIQLIPTGGSAPYTYLWSNLTTSISTNGLTAGNYSVVVSDVSSCSFTLSNMIVTQPSVLNLILVPNPSQICIGQNSIINGLVSGGTSPYNFFWSSTQTTQSITVSPTITTSYTLQVSDNKGCIVSSTTTVLVNPVLNVLTFASQGIICVGQTSSLSATASGGDGGPYTYTWNPSNQSGQSISVSPNQNTQYTVTASDGCSTPVTNTVVINVNQLPVIQYTTTTLSGCEPLTVTYTNITPNLTCSWNINGNLITNCSTTQTFNSPGTYSVTLSVNDVNNCSNISSNIITNVYSQPASSFLANPMITDLLNPVINFTNYSTVGGYSWDFGDGNFSSIINPSNTYSDTGYYNVQLIVLTQNGCRDTSSILVYVSDLFSVYVPNAFTPNSDTKNDYFTPIIVGADYYEFWIFNRWGEEIFHSGMTGDNWDGTYKGSIVKQDVYVWKLIVREKQKVKKHSLMGHVSVIK